MTKYSDKIKELIISPSKELEPLNFTIIEISKTSKDEIEFLKRIKTKINEFLQYELEHIEYLQEDIAIKKSEFYQLRKILMEIRSNLNQFPTKYIQGELTSHKNGNSYKFLYNYYMDYIEGDNGNSYVFEIWSDGNENEGKFSFRLKIEKNGKDLKVVDLYPDSTKKYLGKGISIAIILESKKIFNKRIISSTNVDDKQTVQGEDNSEAAIEKVWKRLVDNDKAKYDRLNGYYYTI